MSEKYTLIDGIKCYAPSLAMENDGFDKGGFERLNALEEKNFWFRIRNKIIMFLLLKYRPVDNPVKLLEIGCGTGFVLKGLSALENFELTGSEIYLEGLIYARERLPDVELIQLDATDMPFQNAYDVIGAFDVLEHITPDEKVMEMVHCSLKDEGLFMITVPQHPWMWSAQDDHAFHKRRYTRKELISKLSRNGFVIEYVSSFVFTLFPLMVFSRYLKRKENPDMMSELRISGLLNSFLFTLMYIDYIIIRLGLSLPFGGSLMCVAKKKRLINAG